MLCIGQGASTALVGHSAFHYNDDFERVHYLQPLVQMACIRSKCDPLENERQMRRGFQLDGRPVASRSHVWE